MSPRRTSAPRKLRVAFAQDRTRATRRLLMDAALRVFVRDGFEKASVQTIAAEAGRTTGALYAHFKDKEHLFLSLLEERMVEEAKRVRALVDQEAGDKPEKLKEAFRKAYVALHDPTWSLLNLELKLYAMRHPASKRRLRGMYEHMPSSRASREYKIHLGSDYCSLETRIFALKSIVSAIVLDTRFDAKRVSVEDARAILGKVYDGVFDDWPSPMPTNGKQSRTETKKARTKRQFGEN